MPDPVQITAVPNRTIVRLKAWDTHQPSNAPIPSGLGGQLRALHISPGEWLLTSDQIDGPALCDRLHHTGYTHTSACVDLSSAIKTLRVEGPFAREVLAKACGLDFHPTLFTAGRSTRTLLAQLPVTIDCTDPAPRFDLYLPRSYLTYLQSWLLDATLEFRNPKAAEGRRSYLHPDGVAL
jgi:heterotetrameric sarcosine oxidase gamma subunit